MNDNIPPQHSGTGYFDAAGFPDKAKWDHIDVPGVTDTEAYALEITGDSMLPIYREGDLIIVSPNSPLRERDRVVVKTSDGKVFVRVFVRQGSQFATFEHFDPAKPAEKLDLAAIVWMARIIWATQ